jgi:hypothetical protein
MATASPAACLNCGATLTGPYCSRCGQKAVDRNLSLGTFIRETTEQLVDWDGKVPATLRTLFLRPGVLTVDFLAGRRARWLSPLRVYLICSIALFAGRAIIDEVGLRPVREMAGFTLKRQDGVNQPLTPEERQQVAAGLPGRVFGVERLERAASDPRAFNSAFEDVIPRAMFVLLPVFALMTSVVWRRAKLRYPAHLYLALHVHSAAFGALLLLSIGLGFAPSIVVIALIEVAFLGYVGWYSLTALHRVFGDSWPKTIVKGVAIAVVYFMCFLTTGMLLLAYAITKM